VLQLLELGFIRDDPMPAAPAGGSAGAAGQAQPARPARRVDIFNKDFIRVMIEFGFDPGASWSAVDTSRTKARTGRRV
jgi:hypothetical protein